MIKDSVPGGWAINMRLGVGFMKNWFTLFTLVLGSSLVLAQTQDLDFKPKETFLEIVDPIITDGEREIYKRLPDHEARRYFEAIFWYKRDPEPTTTSNAFRRNYFERRQIVNLQFGEQGKVGTKTDRGNAFLLLGEPDDVKTRRLPTAGIRPGSEETWTFNEHNLTLRFVYDGTQPGYKLQSREKWDPYFQQVRNRLVLDRAEPYRIQQIPVTLPNLGFTKDVENLASEDKFQLDIAVDYAFFPGDANRTEVMVVLTFRDASTRGVDITLAAYDPYGEKAIELKKLIETTNGKTELFSIAIEPDQYEMVLRLNDKDGREAINRRTIDVPAMRGNDPHASSLLLAERLEDVPLFGFLWPKKFVFDDTYFPIRNDFLSDTSERLYIMQHFYKFPAEPKVRLFLDHEEIPARTEQMLKEGDTYRMVMSIPTMNVKGGVHHINTLFEDAAGNLKSTPILWKLERESRFPAGLISQASRSTDLVMVQPSAASIASLDQVVVRGENGLNIERMYVFLNDQLILEQEKAPWDVRIDEGWYSVSGKNKITVVARTNRGLVRTEKELEPLDVKESYGTRLVNVFFNAFDEELQFLNNLDMGKVNVTVDGNPIEPRKLKKLDDPITYCFMVDTSYSMKQSFTGNIAALRKLIQSMRPQDKGYFITFSNKYGQYLHPNSSKAVLLAVADSLTLDKPNPKSADRLYSENDTFLYDAVISGIHTLLQYPGRTAVVLVSDGIGVEGIHTRNGMLSYARENEAVIFSLWLDNNPKLTEDENKMLEQEMGGGEKFARKIGLSRFFAKKDARKTVAGNKIRNESITQGILKILSEESGGFHYRIFRADRSVIREYVADIEKALSTQYVAEVTLPISRQDHEIDIQYSDEKISIRNKSRVKVSKTNPLLE
jgi:GWxTD domain-containing protein